MSNLINEFKEYLRILGIVYNEDNVIMIKNVLQKSILQKWRQRTYDIITNNCINYINIIEQEKMKVGKIQEYDFSYLQFFNKNVNKLETFIHEFKEYLKSIGIVYNEDNVTMIKNIVNKSIEQKWKQSTIDRITKQCTYYISCIDDCKKTKPIEIVEEYPTLDLLNYYLSLYGENEQSSKSKARKSLKRLYINLCDFMIGNYINYKNYKNLRKYTKEYEKYYNKEIAKTDKILKLFLKKF